MTTCSRAWQDPLGGDLHVVVFLESDPDQLLEPLVLEDLKPLQIPEGNFGRLRGDTRALRPDKLSGTG